MRLRKGSFQSSNRKGWEKVAGVRKLGDSVLFSARPALQVQGS